MRTVYTFLFISITCYTSCDSGIQNTSPLNKIQTQEYNSSDNTVKDLDHRISSDIVGLWKLYKTVYQSGESYVTSYNSFIEIKENRTYEQDGNKGKWALSFGRGKDSLETFTMLTLLRPYTRRNEIKIENYTLDKLQENNTTYLKLLTLSNGQQLFFIRQQ